MPVYVPTATMAPCTLAECPRGSVFLPFGGAPMLVGEVDQHDLAVRLGGEAPYTTVAFSRDERSNVRGVAIGTALFEADPESAYRVREGDYKPGDLLLGRSSTSIIAAHEDGTAFQVAILGDPQRGLEAGFCNWRVGVAGRNGQFVPVLERTLASSPRRHANSNG